MRHRLPLFIRVWFAFDIALALLPPLHWAAGDGGSSFGVPHVLIYMLGASVFTSASVLAAFACDRATGDA